MKKKMKEIYKSKKPTTPQMNIRTSVSAGASLENCLQNLDYWKKEYSKMCGG